MFSDTQLRPGSRIGNYFDKRVFLQSNIPCLILSINIMPFYTPSYMLSRYIDYDLAEKMKEQGADLIVLEGMGRSVHTNLYAAFKSDCLKVSTLRPALLLLSAFLRPSLNIILKNCFPIFPTGLRAVLRARVLKFYLSGNIFVLSCRTG